MIIFLTKSKLNMVTSKNKTICCHKKVLEVEWNILLYYNSNVYHLQ